MKGQLEKVTERMFASYVDTTPSMERVKYN